MAQNLTFPFAPHHRVYLSAVHPWYYDPSPRFWGSMSDAWLPVVVPFTAHWLLCAFFEVLDKAGWEWLEKYRVRESSEVTSRNLVTKRQVITAVLFQQAIQFVITWIWMDSSMNQGGPVAMHVPQMEIIAPGILRFLEALLGPRLATLLWSHKAQDFVYYAYWWGIPLAQLLAAILVMDTWQYLTHRAMHMNAFLYKTFHSRHHRLYAPYAYGALYGHPIEGLVVDMIGAGLSERLMRMSVRQATLLFTLAILKTVDDHCGYTLPFDPLQWFTGNNADYHDIHHQAIGMKSNFSQPFCVHWDAIFGTRMTRQDIEAHKKLKNTEAKSS